MPLKQQEEASFDISNFLKTNADTCRQPLSHDVFNCPKRTRRYMFDVTKGRCVRFWGCRKPGNNFDKKRTCKETCITAYKGTCSSGRLSLKDSLLVNQLYNSGIEIPVLDKNTTQCHLLQNCFRNIKYRPTTYSQFTKPSLQEWWNECIIYYVSLLSLSLNNPPKTCFYSMGLSKTRLDVLLKTQRYLSDGMIMLNRKQVSRSSYSRTPTWYFLMQRERLQDIM